MAFGHSGREMGRNSKENDRGICLEVKIVIHGNPFSGLATVGFEPTFYQMHRIRFAQFPYLKVTANRSAYGTLLRQLVS
jgi:hypothetical protein